jgi:hypothetical protein
MFLTPICVDVSSPILIKLLDMKCVSGGNNTEPGQSISILVKCLNLYKRRKSRYYSETSNTIPQTYDLTFHYRIPVGINTLSTTWITPLVA